MAREGRNVLIVYASQDPRSFNCALKDLAVLELEACGCNVEVSDLYAQNFEPRASRADIEGDLDNEELFNYSHEAKKAVERGTLSDDISEEVEKLKRADLVIFQFPLYWSSTPAILKGWFDRVLIEGVAFDFSTACLLDEGFLKGKKAVLSVTTGGSEKMLSPYGLSGDINVILWPIQYNILRMCGFDVLKPQMNYAVTFVSEETRNNLINQWKNRLRTIFNEEPMKFPVISDFNRESFTFTEQAKDDANQSCSGISIGHHIWKPLPGST